MKEGIVRKGLSAPEMEKINRYTRRIYAPEEVYAFSLVLCDNQVDRDWERFSLEALEGLRELFLGKTCLFDHQRSALGQTARIYDTALETEPERVTQDRGGVHKAYRQGLSASNREKPGGYRAD